MLANLDRSTTVTSERCPSSDRLSSGRASTVGSPGMSPTYLHAPRTACIVPWPREKVLQVRMHPRIWLLTTKRCMPARTSGVAGTVLTTSASVAGGGLWCWV